MRSAILLFALPIALYAQRIDFHEPVAAYSDSKAYGYEPGTNAASLQYTNGCVHSASPFFLSFAKPEGNYRVTVMLGGIPEAANTTVKAELRRLMLEGVRTKAGETATRTFIVNIRAPQIPGGGEVRLKPREKTSEAMAWDNKLTLEFNGEHPSVCVVQVEPAGAIPTIYIAGDSTSTDQPGEPYNSWGQMLTRFFGPSVAIANHGESGETLRVFHRREAAGEGDEHHQAGRLSFGPDGPQRYEGEGRRSRARSRPTSPISSASSKKPASTGRRRS